MTDPQRELYRRLGVLRYAWWLLWVSLAARLVRGRRSGFRLALGLLSLRVSGWSRR